MFRQVTLDQATENIGDFSYTPLVLSVVGIAILLFGFVGGYITARGSSAVSAALFVVALGGLLLTGFSVVNLRSSAAEYAAAQRAELTDLVESEIDGTLTFSNALMPLFAGDSAEVTVEQDGESRRCDILMTDGSAVTLTCEVQTPEVDVLLD